MKATLIRLFVFALLAGGTAFGQASDYYTNFVRQVQIPSGVRWDASVTPSGEQLSPLPINPGGARFELWTVQSDPLLVYLLDSKYVGTYVPIANVNIRTEDPYLYTGVPRTRADRPFVVDIDVSGLRSGITDPEPSKSVKLLRHVQSYGLGGNGTGLDRTQATLLSQVSLVNNATHRLTYTVTSIPGADRSKVAGEERFSVYSLADYQAPELQLSSMYVQIWPVADGSISGLAQNQMIRFKMPSVTLTLNDLYPDSRTYAQVYKGAPQLGTVGTVIGGSSLIVYGAVPQSRVLVLEDWDAVIDTDGQWTMELLTSTPFGVDRLAYVTFDVDRTIEMNGTFTTIE
jgi:hypothetical protein